jgi:hypothetical protein
MRAAASISIALVAAACSIEAFAPAPQQWTTVTTTTALSASRREAMEKFGAAAFSAGAVFFAGEQKAHAAQTEEDEFNELINVLKARTEANKEANANYAMRADKLSKRDFDDAKTRRPKLIVVSTKNGNKIYSSEEFNTLDSDGKIKTEYGVRQKQGGGEIKDYQNITYTLLE